MMTRWIFHLLCLAMAVVLATRPGHAVAEETKDGTAWAGVFLGSAQPSALGTAATTDLAKSVVDRMGKVASLKFPHYRLLGEHVQPLLKEYESWLVPSRGFFFKLDSRGPDAKGGVRVAVQLWRDKEVLVKTDVVLKGDRPVLVRGPALGTHGTLIIALRLVKPAP